MKGEQIDPGRADAGVVQALGERLRELARDGQGRLRLAIAGESGSGKSTLARALAEWLEGAGLGVRVLQLDDYYRLPPASNAGRRAEDPTWVGPGEVQLDLLDEHLRLAREAERLEKPLVDYAADAIEREVVELAGVDVVLVEGTWAARLEQADLRVFVAGSPDVLRARHAQRGREEQDAVLLAVLAREHELIQPDRALCQLVVEGGSLSEA